jgi:hypothetical protein
MKGFALPEGLTDFFELLKNDLSFANLRIELDKLTGIDPRFMTIHYPSLKFDLNLPHIGLLGDALKLKFHQLIVDWGGGGFDLGSFLPLPNLNLPGIDVKLPKLVFLGRIDFGSLPELFARSLSGFSLEGAFGFNFSGGKLTGGPFLGIRGFGFSGLDLDLASFITIRIGRLALNSRKWTNGSEGAAISLEDGSLSILKYTVLERLSGGYFSLKDNGGDGFWALLSRSPSQSPNFFVDFRYAFAGRNIDFPPALARVLLVPPPQEGDSQAHDQIHRQLQTAWSNEESGGTKPPLDLYPAARGGGRGWTFGAGIDALGGALTGRALLQDGGFTGLSLKGPVLKELLGWDFAFTGIYRKDITPGEDYFYFSVTLPQFTMGTIRFMGGEIAAEIYTSGDFMADFGFPWPARQGGRAWERTIGAIVTPGQASGGAYIRKREYMQPGENRLALAGGVAIQWGLGASFGGGVFQVWVRIGLYAAMEGSITFELLDSGGVIPKLGKISAFDVQGAAGILVEGAGEIDWWVISARVGVRASAEIRTAILWRVDQPVQMAVVAELYVSAYAEACIGPSWARICRDISVGLDITVRHQLRFG